MLGKCIDTFNISKSRVTQSSFIYIVSTSLSLHTPREQLSVYNASASQHSQAGSDTPSRYLGIGRHTCKSS